MGHMNSKQSWRAFFIVTFMGIAGMASATEKEILYEDRAVSADGMTFHKYVDADGIIHAVVYDRDGNEIEWNEKKERPSDVVGERLAEALTRGHRTRTRGHRYRRRCGQATIGQWNSEKSSR